ncbi:MAG: O-antigen ligase family protein, partial [Dermatophilaceae bacterium]
MPNRPAAPANHARTQRLSVAARWGAPLLLSGLTFAVVAQGAYYTWAQLAVAALIGAALIVTPGLTRLTSSDHAIALPAGALAAWALLVAVLHANPLAAAPYVGLLAGAVAVLINCSRFGEDASDLLLTGLICCGVLVAGLGWLGVVLHDPRWAWQGQGLWRASSTLTYPNATAIVLAMLALLAIARSSAPAPSIPLRLATTGLLTGLAATLSRGGLLALAVGILILAALIGPRVLLRAGGAALLGAAVAAVGLAPAMTSASATPAVAVAALAVGLAISAALPLVHLPRLAVTGLVVAAVVLGVSILHGAVSRVAAARLTVDDPDRSASFQAALHVFADQPITGAGPSLPTLTWESGTGSTIYRYAHNEYLQVLAELGAIGGLLLAALLVMILRRLYRARTPNAAVQAGALAALAA